MKNRESTSLPFIERDLQNIPRFAHHVMGTVYEIYICHKDKIYAEQAANEAFREINRLEQDLSRFIHNSDISRINHLKTGQYVQVGMDTFENLKQCASLYNETEGVFDVTVGPLRECWINEDKSVTDEEIGAAMSHVGMHLIVLDDEKYRVGVRANNMQIDLGGFGKGYAVDRAIEILKEWDIDAALVHGGMSTAYALGSPNGFEAWPLTLSHPSMRQKVLARIRLKDRALSASGLEKGAHIIDPLSGFPVRGKLAAWASALDAATSDALSTTFMVMTEEKIKSFCQDRDSICGLFIKARELQDNSIDPSDIVSYGFEMIGELVV